jgi:hypothetical protein
LACGSAGSHKYQSTRSRPQNAAKTDGFEWGDAGIGAGVTLAR